MNTSRVVEMKAGESGFLELLGFDKIEAADGRGLIELEVQARHLRSLGIIHGGVVASMLDTVIGVATRSVAPPGRFAVTVQLNVNFIRPAWPGERLIATSEIQHEGRQTVVGRGEVRTAEGMLVGAATGTFMFLPIPEAGVMQRQPDS